MSNLSFSKALLLFTSPMYRLFKILQCLAAIPVTTGLPKLGDKSLLVCTYVANLRMIINMLQNYRSK